MIVSFGSPRSVHPEDENPWLGQRFHPVLNHSRLRHPRYLVNKPSLCSRTYLHSIHDRQIVPLRCCFILTTLNFISIFFSPNHPSQIDRSFFPILQIAKFANNSDRTNYCLLLTIVYKIVWSNQALEKKRSGEHDCGYICKQRLDRKQKYKNIGHTVVRFQTVWSEFK